MLRIAISERDRVALFGEPGGQMDSHRRLAHSPFIVRNRDNHGANTTTVSSLLASSISCTLDAPHSGKQERTPNGKQDRWKARPTASRHAFCLSRKPDFWTNGSHEIQNDSKSESWKSVRQDCQTAILLADHFHGERSPIRH